MNNKPNKKKTSAATRFTVTEQTELLPFLLNHLDGSRSRIKSMLAHNQIQVNGKRTSQFNWLLMPNDVIEIAGRETAETSALHPLLKIVYEDDYLIVVDKGSGLLTVPSKNNSKEATAFTLLKNYVKQTDTRNRVFPVHRLDRETSGLLMFVKDADLEEYMRNNWRTVLKRRFYTAVVHGQMEHKKDKIVSWLTENSTTKLMESSFKENSGKKAITHYETINNNDLYSLLELHLDTGRKNQIRVQLAAIGHPVVGDIGYGKGDEELVKRLCLHARVLEFEHPATHEIMHFETPVPYLFSQLIKG